MSLLLTLASAQGTESRGVEYTGALIIVLQVALIVLLTPGLASGMIAGEMEGGSWNLLRVTPLESGANSARKTDQRRADTGILLLCHAARLCGHYADQTNAAATGRAGADLSCFWRHCCRCWSVRPSAVSFDRRLSAQRRVSYGVNLVAIFGVGTMLIWMNRWHRRGLDS